MFKFALYEVNQVSLEDVWYSQHQNIQLRST